MSTKKNEIRSNEIKRLLNVVVLAIFITVIVLFSSKKTNVENTIETKTVVNKIEKVEKKKLTIDKDENIVIFGDSITEIYPADEIYGDLPIINSGTSGYKTTNLLEEMDTMLYKYNPTKVILLIGINDVLYDTSDATQDKTINNIKEIVNKIQENRPKSKIYIESIYPVNKSMDRTFDFKINNEIIRNMNNKIKDFCNEKKLTYINMHDELTDENGNFDSRYTYDGLHPSTLGYAKITRVLLPYIYE